MLEQRRARAGCPARIALPFFLRTLETAERPNIISKNFARRTLAARAMFRGYLTVTHPRPSNIGYLPNFRLVTLRMSVTIRLMGFGTARSSGRGTYARK